MKRTLLLSGGMDSIALAWWLKPELCVTIDYGQLPAAAEIDAARAVCTELGLSHEVIQADCSALGSGDLAGKPVNQLAPVREWWPYRNQLLVTLAAAHIAGREFKSLLIGCLRTDVAHRDGTIQFIEAMSNCLQIQEGGLRLQAPAVAYDAPELIRHSGVPLRTLLWSHSCHTGVLACGHCRGCHKRWYTLEALGHAPH